MKFLILFLLMSASVAVAGLFDVTSLGAKNDGSADISAIVNEATKTSSLYLPPGVYKVASPLRLRNPLRGAGAVRVPKVDAMRTRTPQARAA